MKSYFMDRLESCVHPPPPLPFKIQCKESITTGSRTSCKIIPLTNLNKYLYNGKSEGEVNINNLSEKLYKKHCD